MFEHTLDGTGLQGLFDRRTSKREVNNVWIVHSRGNGLLHQVRDDRRLDRLTDGLVRYRLLDGVLDDWLPVIENGLMNGRAFDDWLTDGIVYDRLVDALVDNGLVDWVMNEGLLEMIVNQRLLDMLMDRRLLDICSLMGLDADISAVGLLRLVNLRGESLSKILNIMLFELLWAKIVRHRLMGCRDLA